jgi:hypothetical protein
VETDTGDGRMDVAPDIEPKTTERKRIKTEKNNDS